MEQKSLPLISVIVSVYNIEKYLPLCVNSILEQTYNNLEILLIDDGSTDNSGKICDDFCVQDKRCKAIHQKNEGQSGARNTGMRKATGDYISFIDGDDYIHPKFYEVLYAAINEGDYAFSMVGYKQVTGGGEIRIGDLKFPYKTRVLSRNELMEELFRLNIYGPMAMIVVWNKLYKRETINGLEFLHIEKSEDHEYNTRIFLNSSSAIVVENTELYYYVQRPTSNVHQPFGHRNIEIINTMTLCLNDIPTSYPQYRGWCLERLYKTILSTRYYAPANFKSEVSQVIKQVKKATMKEYIKNHHISFIIKASTLLFYYFPLSYSFYLWLIQKKII